MITSGEWGVDSELAEARNKPSTFTVDRYNCDRRQRGNFDRDDSRVARSKLGEGGRVGGRMALTTTTKD